MRPELRERREKTWRMLVCRGIPYTEVCERLAAEYDVKPNTIEKDISRMDNWLPDLDNLMSHTARSRLKEMRENRQRLHQMAVQAADDADLKTELDIRSEITDAIESDVSLAQSVGLTVKEPERVEVDADHSLDLPDETASLLANLHDDDTDDD